MSSISSDFQRQRAYEFMDADEDVERLQFFRQVAQHNELKNKKGAICGMLDNEQDNFGAGSIKGSGCIRGMGFAIPASILLWFLIICLAGWLI
jgi:hypothetical protein